MLELIYELEQTRTFDVFNVRLMQKIKYKSLKFDEEFASEVTDLVDEHDAATSKKDSGQAKMIIDKLLGMLDAAVEQQNDSTTYSNSDDLIPKFQLGPEDKARVLELCTQMRKIVLATDVFDQPHKRRLLDRIAGIEHQVEQPQGILDIVRAGVSDVGETLGKFGTDIKPLTDRMKEVAGIARSGSKQYEQIPAPEELPKLPAPDNSEGQE